jgi:hypothetical protein
VATHAADIAPTGDPSCLDHFLWQQARRHAQEAVRLDPAGAGPVFVRAYVDLRSGQDKAARRGFRAVLAIDPTDDAAHNNLAVLEMKRLRLIRAGATLAGLAGADPGSRRCPDRACAFAAVGMDVARPGGRRGGNPIGLTLALPVAVVLVRAGTRPPR